MPKIRSSPRNKTTPSKTTPPVSSPQTPEMPPKNTPTSRRKKTTPHSSSSLKTGDDQLSYLSELLEDDSKTNSSTTSSLDNQLPVGQQLLEHLDKTKKKKHKVEGGGTSNNNSGPITTTTTTTTTTAPASKKAIPPLKVCSNCGTEAKTTRTKKCHVCKQFLFPSLARRYSSEPCSNCNEIPKLSRTGRPSHCSNCSKPLLNDSSDDISSSVPTDITFDGYNEGEEVKEEEEEEKPHSPLLSVGYGSNVTIQLSQSSVPSSSAESLVLCGTDSDNSLLSSDSPICLKTKVRQILKRKILSKKRPPPMKVTTATTTDSPPTNNNKSSLLGSNNKGGVTLSLSLPPVSSSSSYESMSSPLLEYAQKISARVMIPPEIPQVQRKNIKHSRKVGGAGGGANNKGPTGKGGNKGGSLKGAKGSKKHDDSSDIEIPEEATPISRHSTPPIFTTDTSCHSSLDSLVVSVATKPHDPTINSIRTLHGYQRPHSLVSTSYSSLGHTPSLPPPLILHSKSSHHYTSLPPPLFTNHSIGPPPLVSASWTASEQCPSWYNNDVKLTTPTTRQATPTVAHQPVIVDPKRSVAEPVVMITKNDLISNEIMEPESTNTVSIATDTIPMATDTISIANNTASMANESVSIATDTVPMTTDTVSVATNKVPMTTDTVSMTTDAAVSPDDNIMSELATDQEEVMKQHSYTEEEQDTSEVKVKQSSKHKRKQILELQNYDDEEQSKLVKKKKKKKKKEKEKDKERDEHYSSNSKHHHDKKKKKKSKKREREDNEEDLFIEQPPGASNTDHKKITPVYSVKIDDATLHQLRWGKFRMTLLIPSLTKKKRFKSVSEREATPVPVHAAEKPASIKQEVTPEDTPTKSRSLRSRRKRVREEVEEEEEEEIEPIVKKHKKTKKKKQQVDEELSCVEGSTSSNKQQSEETEEDDEVIVSPSFSIFELRNKLFHKYPPRTVHAFTYKLKLKTRRPPLHWIHVLRHMGGLPENCHTCRFLDMDAVRQLCEFYNIEMPTSLSLILNNSLNPTRKVYDLRGEDVLSLISNPELLHSNIPKCYFGDIPKKKSYSKKSKEPKPSPPTTGTTTTGTTGTTTGTTGTTTDTTGTTIVPPQEREEEEDEEEEQDTETPTEPIITTQDEEEEEETLSPVKTPLSPSFPSLTATTTSSSSQQQQQSKPGPGSTGRKKPCPHCGVSVLCKSKKCRNCGKLFGVFTFGRRICTVCGHINLARMTACFRCSHTLDKAPTAKPKDIDDAECLTSTEVGKVPSVSKFNFKFGVKKRLRTHRSPNYTISPPPSATSTTNSATKSGGKKQQHYGVDDVIDDLFTEGVRGIESVTNSPNVDKKKKGKTEQHLGYRYGKIPWSDADLALVITNKGISKFCLQETCNKVLKYHNKTDVFEMVKNLHLPLEQGNASLLRKLQALGLHPNRSPICKLISADDLFALMDAMEEPVPEEVHQHLETISCHSTPQSPCSPPGITPVSSLVLPSTSSSISHQSIPLVGGVEGGVKETEDNEFESTLHDIRCSDGQSLSMLRTWKGDNFLCLLEVWRRYFPEVNRSHLSATIKKLQLDTHIPTSQQTNLLRAANVISMRGAPGRLIGLQNLQILLDDFGVPVQIGGNGEDLTEYIVNKPVSNYYARGRYGGSNEMSHVRQLSNCMRHLVNLVDSEELVPILERKESIFQEESDSIEIEINALSMELDMLQHALYDGRDLCQALSDEIGFLTVTNHSQMMEIVRLGRVSLSSLNEIDVLMDNNYSQLMEY